MLIPPTRTNLLLLREKALSVANGIGILKARRQALIREFLAVTIPFMRSRDEIRKTYGHAIRELSLALGREGEAAIDSLASAASRDFRIEIAEKSVWGLVFKDISFHEAPIRNPDERGYDWRLTSIHVEEAINLFERILEAMLAVAEYETRMKRLADEIMRTMRRIRVLEERVLPDLHHNIKSISYYLSEREREAYFRLKRFKQKQAET